MKCPHCLNVIHSEPKLKYILDDINADWVISYEICPSCNKIILNLINGEAYFDDDDEFIGINQIESKLVYPKGTNRPLCPIEVPINIKNDYIEACLILQDSPKASAALSRRCLQSIIRDKAGVRRGDLSTEIQEVIDSKMLPSQISETIDSVRNIGNFAAYPIKSTASGEIIEVEEQEAEWNLDVIEALIDFYYVAPKKVKDKKDKLNAKLKEAGKPEMK